MAEDEEDEDKISFRVPNSEDFEVIFAFLLKHFVPNESTLEALSITGENAECRELLRQMIQKSFQDPTSLLVLNSKNEIIAVSLNYFVYNVNSCDSTDRNDNSEAETAYDKIACNLSAFATLAMYLNSIEAGYSRLIPKECEKLLKMEIGCVNTEEYGRRGVAKKALKAAIENAITLQCQGVLLQATSLASQSLLRKENFEVLKVIMHENFLDETGKQLIICKDGTDQGQLLFKRLPP